MYSMTRAYFKTETMGKKHNNELIIHLIDIQVWYVQERVSISNHSEDAQREEKIWYGKQTQILDLQK